MRMERINGILFFFLINMQTAVIAFLVISSVYIFPMKLKNIVKIFSIILYILTFTI